MSYSAEELSRFRTAQALAYECAETIAAELRPGISERQAASQMKDWLVSRGVRDWFHQPFAWFGDRTAFRGLIAVSQLKGFNPAFYPGGRKLQQGMPFILDCAPVFDGAVADIGYAGALGDNSEMDKLMDALIEHRQLIVEQIRQGKTLAEVSRAVDALCERQGVEPRHKAYPFSVLAHRVEKLDEQKKPHSLMRFGIKALTELRNEVLQGRKEGWSPLWNSSSKSDHPPTPGLWAVEPHLGLKGVGAKFEELLVITDNDAFWLDDDLPHVRRWQQRGLLQAA